MNLEPHKSAPGCRRTLVLDADSDQRSLLDSFLRSQALQTILASSGVKALRLLDQQEVQMMRVPLGTE